MNITKTSITAAFLVCLVVASSASRPPVQASEPKPATIIYFLRVVARQSQAPVKQAKVTVALKTAAQRNWSGLTNASGFFQFTWAANHDPVQAHISVQARGFASFDQYSLLTPDTLIELKREQK